MCIDAAMDGMEDWASGLGDVLRQLDPTANPQTLFERIWPAVAGWNCIHGIWLHALPGHLQPAGIAQIGRCPAQSEQLAKRLGNEQMAFEADGLSLCGRQIRDGNVPVASILISHAPDKPQIGMMLLEALNRYCVDRLRLQLQTNELIEENQQLRDSLQPRVGQHDIISVSGVMQNIINAAARAAASTATVLIQGETGTGKELLARLIHSHSPRSNKPLISVNAGALSHTLLESELFGHTRGSFTGAERDRQGLFEVAAGGTLFLDEIGELTLSAQVRLLRALQEKTISRVGDHRPIPVDVRIIAATHRNLEQEVAAGRFRQDLFYRLNIVSLQLPSLRERTEDIPVLVDHFLHRFNRENFKNVTTVPPECLETLQAYPWPGNIRELENCVQKGVIMAQGNRLELNNLPSNVRSYQPSQRSGSAPNTPESQSDTLPIAILSQAIEQFASNEGPDLHRFVLIAERMLITHALNAERGVKLRAAKQLGINRVTLDRKLAEYGIQVKRGKGVVPAANDDSHASGYSQATVA